MPAAQVAPGQAPLHCISYSQPGCPGLTAKVKNKSIEIKCIRRAITHFLYTFDLNQGRQPNWGCNCTCRLGRTCYQNSQCCRNMRHQCQPTLKNLKFYTFFAQFFLNNWYLLGIPGVRFVLDLGVKHFLVSSSKYCGNPFNVGHSFLTYFLIRNDNFYLNDVSEDLESTLTLDCIK